MLIHPWDAAEEREAWDLVEAQGFGQLIASGRGRDVPVVVPTQLVLERGERERPDVLLHIPPSGWKTVGQEDPALGIPTTYYAAVQLVGRATVPDRDDEVLRVLRAQLARLEPATGVADPEVHRRRLPGIRGLRLTVEEIKGKLKYGGNVDVEHRASVARRLAERGGPGDAAALRHLTGSS